MSTAPTKALGGARTRDRLLRGCAVAIGALALFALTAQGGINGGGRARGVITAFGSIFVNGVEYGLAGSTITVNGSPATEAQLRIGQVVTVDGVVSGGTSGQASSVAFESDVRGAVTAVDPVAATFTVLGQKVKVDGGTVFDAAFVPANLAGIAVGRVVEVSGFRNSTSQLVATRVQPSASSGDRVVGTISSLNETTLRFKIGALTVDYSNAAVIKGNLANGVLVEVRGPRAIGTTLKATRVEVEDEFGGESGEGGSIEGIVTSAYANGVFAINGQVIVVNTSTQFVDGTRADLVADARAEAEGRFDSRGRIAATKVEIKHPDDAYVFATVGSVNLTSKTVGLVGLKVTTNAQTRFVDQGDLRLQPFALKDLHTGDTVEIRGYETRLARNVTAQRLTRLKDDNRTRIGGRVSSVRSGSFVVLDLNVVTSTGTVFRDKAGRAITAAKFYSTAANREVRVRGDWNGTTFVAEEVELED
jgi:hypothetical protein